MRSRPNARVWLVLACVALAGCGTEEKKGEVGDELEAGSVRAELKEVSARAGHFGANAELCKDSEQSVNAFAFSLALEGGGEAERVYPQRVYDDGFGRVRDGCEGGWLVYDVPKGSKPSALKFEYEDTGQGGPGGDDGEHIKFEWKLP